MTLSPTPTLKVDLGTPSDRLQSFWKIPLQSEVRCVWYVSKVFSGVNLKMCRLCRQKIKHRKLKLENWWPYNPSIWCFVGMAPQESYEQAAVKSREQHFKRSRVSEKCIPALKTWIRCDLNAKKGTGLHPWGSTASFRLEKFNELRCLQPDYELVNNMEPSINWWKMTHSQPRSKGTSILNGTLGTYFYFNGLSNGHNPIPNWGLQFGY